MKLIEKILLATDFLESSDNVVDNAVQLAGAFDAEVVPIHVLPPDIRDEKARRLLLDAAGLRMEQLRARLEEAGVIPGEPVVETGQHYQVIVETADRIDANLIMIGAGEKKEKDRFRLGTTAEKIIRQSDRPVWVVKQGQPLRVKTILCPVDFSEPAERALKNAIVLARRFEAELIVLSVYEPLSSRGLIYHQKEWEDQDNRGRSQYKGELGAYLKKQNWHDVNWKKEVRSGAPEAEILAAVEQHQADLLIMGTTGRSGLSRLMVGSVTEKVIREVPCTFVTTKSEDVIKLRLENSIRDIDSHYQEAQQLMRDGYFEEAIREFHTCLQISDMHLPSLNGLVKVYEKMGDTEAAERHKQMAKEVLHTIWDAKIEEEIRKGFKT